MLNNIKMFFKDIINFDESICNAHIIKRHNTQEVTVGKVKIGNGNPVVVQSMALGNTNDISKKSQEVIELAKAGSELIRIALNSDESAQSIPYIRDELVKNGFDDKILVGCGQYEIARLLRQYPDSVSALGKIRINPGNIGFGDKRDKNFEKVIEYAIKYDLPVRIGVNWGSIDKYVIEKLINSNALLKTPMSYDALLRKALIISVLTSAQYAEKIGLSKNKIVISCKVSKVQDLIAIYTVLAKVSDYALHLGLTESGMGAQGIISTTSALSYLLLNGIGDTIRASLTQQPGQSRVHEVKVCQEILQSLGLRTFFPQVISCPGCGRTNGSYFQQLTLDINNYIKERMPIWKKNRSAVENMKIAVMGCIVNGPGESKHANLGISLPGYGEAPMAAVYMNGKKYCILKGGNILKEFTRIIEEYVDTYFA